MKFLGSGAVFSPLVSHATASTFIATSGSQAQLFKQTSLEEETTEARQHGKTKSKAPEVQALSALGERDGFDLVAVRIANEGAEIGRQCRFPVAGRAVTDAAARERGFMEGCYGITT